MNIHTYPLGQMQANCYLLEQDGEAVLIDPGDSADFLLEKIAVQHLKLVGIIATHGHFDHIMAVGEIQLSYPDLPLYIHPKDTFLLDRVVETAKHFLDYEPATIPITNIQNLVIGKFEIFPPAGGLKFEILHTPGHTPGSCALYLKDKNILFSGDTLFKDGIGRYDFAYSDKEELKSSLKSLLSLPPETIVYPGHGPETSIEEE